MLCNVLRADAVQLSSLDQPSVASVHGGAIASKRLADGRRSPLQPTFRIRLEGCDMRRAPDSEIPGVAVIDSDPESLAARCVRWLGAAWGREGFF